MPWSPFLKSGSTAIAVSHSFGTIPDFHAMFKRHLNQDGPSTPRIIYLLGDWSQSPMNLRLCSWQGAWVWSQCVHKFCTHVQVCIQVFLPTPDNFLIRNQQNPILAVHMVPHFPLLGCLVVLHKHVGADGMSFSITSNYSHTHRFASITACWYLATASRVLRTTNIEFEGYSLLRHPRISDHRSQPHAQQ